jgi:hypothetical protein
MQASVASPHPTESSSPRTLTVPDSGRKRGSSGGGLPYLVKDGKNSTSCESGKGPRPVWGRREKTHFHRLQSFLYFWESHHFSVIRMDLTTAEGGDSSLLGDHFEELLRRISRKEGRKVEYWRLTTNEGNGVIHSLLAAPGEKSLYVEHKWLSNQWRRIHGAPRVYVKRYRYGEDSRMKVSRYLVSQYMAGQPAARHLSTTAQSTFGFPLAATWALFREGARGEGRFDALDRWQGLLRGETVSPREGVSLNLAWLRGARLRLKLRPGWGPGYPSPTALSANDREPEGERETV